MHILLDTVCERASFNLSKKALPIQQTKPEVNITSTLTFIASIASATTTPLADMQKKTVFLLAMTAFFCPSDLSRLQLSSAQIHPHTETLTFDGKSPKERRKRRRIIKIIRVQRHSTHSLCPVLAFAHYVTIQKR
ncbi:hypothetical protein PHYBLDRAFT_153788 [Phycomyces blakesleeanus NRRL 1555(-)]|uniref:Uncharacterized protein n=1 Tax=Phycomyces blakesleeanus (strain ATCC 8743b / DSM 1359 / FGSC 10004 / NBRC 33097 / NRRL 1555) TaxID=763407 RepID=A0A167J485_PHYB8|nr:hypothetical protein PHYBLDRAFT_153788 [Phycomyces blakesleeanus NRRL 1555(-)]OAD65109.1 hypothetical protein PHYBLDRAFT_153788 [Phycomyces blakesleeanus NRRL 1555(-)]|eukprot:XP_018283149.1 hypothetical protein PHYBLDRAFT_153788 [Phycomyces blakesleeanus NRRL 1555(-)]